MSESVYHESPLEICVVETHSPFAGTLETQNSTHTFRRYCSPCSMHFDDKSEFDYHISEMHTTDKTLRQIEKTYSCSMCSQTFKRHDHLKRHISSLHTEKKYSKCPVCGIQYSDKLVLSRHIKKVHAGEKEVFKCRDCQYQCNSLKVLLIHELDHVGRHRCPHCTLSYKRRDHMTRHIKTEHLKLVVPCSMCKQVYKRKDHLVRHMREKHNTPGTLIDVEFVHVENV